MPSAVRPRSQFPVYSSANPPASDVGIFVIAKTGVNLKAGAVTDIFTVPTGRAFVATDTYIFVTAVTTGGAGQEIWQIIESSSSRIMTGLTTSSSGTPVANQTFYRQVINASPVLSSCSAGNKVQVQISVSQAGSTAVTGTVYVTGFYQS